MKTLPNKTTSSISTLALLESLQCYTTSQLTHDIDLTTRQMLVLLTVYVRPAPHTIKSLSEKLGIPKSAICRALDILGRHELVRRKRDDQDRRTVFVQRTVKGSVFLTECADMLRLQFTPLFTRQPMAA